MNETNDLFLLLFPLSLLHSKDLQIPEAHQFIGLSQAPGVKPSLILAFSLSFCVESSTNLFQCSWVAGSPGLLFKNIHVKIKSQRSLSREQVHYYAQIDSFQARQNCYQTGDSPSLLEILKIRVGGKSPQYCIEVSKLWSTDQMQPTACCCIGADDIFTFLGG